MESEYVLNPRAGDATNPENLRQRLSVDFAPAHWDYASAPGNTRISSGEFTAEIIVDHKTDPPIFHSIIQKTGSSDIVVWSQAQNFEEVEDQTQAMLSDLSSKAS